MRPTSEAVFFLSRSTVDAVVELIRRDAILGCGSHSSWEEVTPSDYEARERVCSLVEEGVVPMKTSNPTPKEIVEALRAFEASFWITG